MRKLALAKNIAKMLRSCKIAISLDDVGAGWTSLTGLRDFPFVVKQEAASSPVTALGVAEAIAPGKGES